MPPPPPPPSPLTPYMTEQPTFAELAGRLQTLLVKTDVKAPITPPRIGASSAINATALLNRSMQQLVVTTLMRSPSSQNLSQPSTPKSYSHSPSMHSPDCSLAPTPMSRRSSTSESVSSISESLCSFSETGEDATNWRDTWKSTSSDGSVSSKNSYGNLSLSRRFPGDSRIRSIRKPLGMSPAATDIGDTESTTSDDHVVDVKPDPNDSP